MRKKIKLLVISLWSFFLCVNQTSSEPIAKAAYANYGVGVNEGRSELNKAFGIKDSSNPLFFVFVNRTNSIDPIGQTDWRNILGVLEYICKDKGNCTHLTTINESKVIDNYAKASLNKLRDSGKLVIFNETIFGKQTLTNEEYNNFKDGLIKLSKSCKKAIFYPNFLYKENYDSTNTDHVKIWNRYNSITKEMLDRVNDSISGYTTKAAKILLKNLANNLRISQGTFSKEAINALDDALGLRDHSNTKEDLASSIESSIDAAVEELKKAGAALKFNALLTTGGTAAPLAVDDAPAEELKNLTNALKINDEVAGAAAILIYLDNFISLEHSTNRIQSNSFMLPLINPKFIIKNATQSIYDEQILTEYLKTAYFYENNGEIGITTYNGLGTAIFGFGDGHDIALPILATTNQKKYSEVQDALLKNISVEICYDLANGVRHSNGWNNKDTQSHFLILQSNIIDPIGRIYSNNNINHLPRSCEEHKVWILHANATKEPPAGSHMFTINTSGAPVLFDNEKINNQNVLINLPNDITITLYKF